MKAHRVCKFARWSSALLNEENAQKICFHSEPKDGKATKKFHGTYKMHYFLGQFLATHLENTHE